jgi:CRISPR-associated protein Csd1
MLLSVLNDYAQRHDLLADRGFIVAPVRWIICLGADGQVQGAGPIDTATEDDRRGRELRVPATRRNKNAGGVAEFLVDGLTALFGLDPDPVAAGDGSAAKQARRRANNAEKLADFWRQVEAAARATGSDALRALLAFRDGYRASGGEIAPPFLRFGPPAPPAEATGAKAKRRAGGRKPSAAAGARWLIRAADGSERPLESGDRFAFEVGGTRPLDAPEVVTWWRAQAEAERAEEEAQAARGVCLVTGQADVPIAATHEAIKSVPGARAGGALLVSAYGEAFQSFGFVQGANSPVSLAARDGYAAALQHLLDQPHHHLVLGKGTVLVWWAREEEIDCMSLLDAPLPESVAEFLRAPWRGRAERIDDNEFFSLVLAGNSARIAVRHWVREPLRAAVANLVRWFVDLQIAPFVTRRPDSNYRPLALYWLAATTVRDAAKELRPETILQLYRAAVEGLAPSLALLPPLLGRLRARFARDGSDALAEESRFALLRLIVNRNRREGEPMVEPVLTDTNDPAYNCGRLLAMLQRLQAAAHDYELKGPGIAERYYGTASTAPAAVLPVLLRLGRHHLRKLEQSERGRGAAAAIEQRLGEVLARFQGAAGSAPAFPTLLSLAEQGRFALGYYQQQVHERTQIQERKQGNGPQEG